MGGGEAQVQSKALVGLKLSAIGDQTQQRPTSESSRSHWLRLNGIQRRYPPFKTEDQLFLQKKNPTKAGISWAPSVVEESSCHRVIAVERSLRLSITYPVVCRLAAASACWCQQQDNCRRAVATASVLQRQSPSHDPELTRQS